MAGSSQQPFPLQCAFEQSGMGAQLHFPAQPSLTIWHPLPQSRSASFLIHFMLRLPLWTQVVSFGPVATTAHALLKVNSTTQLLPPAETQSSMAASAAEFSESASTTQPISCPSASAIAPQAVPACLVSPTPCAGRYTLLYAAEPGCCASAKVGTNIKVAQEISIQPPFNFSDPNTAHLPGSIDTSGWTRLAPHLPTLHNTHLK